MIIIGKLVTQEQKDFVLQYFINESYNIRMQLTDWDGIRVDDSSKKITLGSFDRYIYYRTNNKVYKNDVTLSYNQFTLKVNKKTQPQDEITEESMIIKALNQCDCSKLVSDSVVISRNNIKQTFNNLPEYRAFLLSLFPDILSELVINPGDKIVFDEDKNTWLMCSGSYGKFLVSCTNGLIGYEFSNDIITAIDIENIFDTKEFKIVKNG